MKKPRGLSTTTWLDLTNEDYSGSKAVIKDGEVSPMEACHDKDGNLIYDYETDMVFTLLADPWPPTTIVAETLDQYEPREL